MRSSWSLLCLGALGVLLMLSSDVATGPAGVNCRRFVYHPVCRGVAAKRSEPPETHRHLRQEDRKQEEEGPDSEYVPVPVNLDMTGETPPRRALWPYLAERPAAAVLLARRKLEPENFDLYDYE